SILFDGTTRYLREAMPQVIASTADADLFITHHIDVCGYAASIVHRRPRVAGCLMHHALPARARTPDGANWGAALNRLVCALYRRGLAAVTDGSFNELMAAAGLLPKKRLVLDATDSALTTLVGLSPLFVPPDPLWAGRYHVT